MTIDLPRRMRLLLATSWILRALLALGGGQMFWPDEWRYYWRACVFGRSLASAHPIAAALLLAKNPDHSLFIPVAALGAAAHKLAMSALGLSFDASLWAPSLVLSTASVACIGLVYAIARRAGADQEEAFLAALLLAASDSMFYFARHILPYDASLALILLSLWSGLGERAAPARSLLCGLGLGLAWLVYNGHWAACASVLALHCAAGPSREAGRRAAEAGLGFLLPLAALSGLSAADGLPSYLGRLQAFSRTVTQGDLTEGWRLPWEYLWHAEHGLLLAWAAGAFLAARQCLRRPGRGRLWLGGALLLYALMSASSSGLGLFVVYGRTARPLVPFLCLAAAFGASHAKGFVSRPSARTLLAVALLFQTAFNFRAPLAQVWPLDVLARSGADVDCGLTVTGPSPECPTRIAGVTSRKGPARFILLNVAPLVAPLGPKPAPAGRVLSREAHPLQFEPYLYEGLTPAMRAVCRAADISIRLIDTAPPGK